MENFKLKPVAIILIAIVVLSAGAVAIFSSRSSAENEPKAVAAKPALTVATALPQQLSLPVRLSANGNIAAWQEAIIGSESNGLRLTQVLVNVGDRVKAGQVLAVFYEGSVQAEVAQARASLIEAQANAADAADNAARARTLESSGALSAQQINQFTTAEQTAKARAEVARAVLDAQQLRGRQTKVLAPDNGVISARTATVGSVVGAGTELFRMIRGGRLEWRAEVTSAELGRIQAGTSATVVAASGAQLVGRVRMIAPSVDPQTRTALVYVDLPVPAGMASPAKVRSAGPPQASTAPSGGSAVREATSVGATNEAPGRPRRSSAPSGGSAAHEVASVGATERSAGPPQASSAPSGGSAAHEVASVGAILAGMFARGEFDLGTTPALTVPQAALVVRDGFNYVFCLNPDNRVSQVKVQTGRLAGDRVEITSGLAAATRVVVSGAGFLNDGDLVRVNDVAAQNVPVAPVNSAQVATK